MSIRSLLRAVMPTGWYVVVVVIVGVILGAVSGWIEAWFLATLGAVLLLVALPFLFGTRAYRIRIKLGSGSVVAGEALRAEIEVVNTAARPQLPAIAELAITAVHEHGGVSVSDLASGQEINAAREDETATAILEVAIPLLGRHQEVNLPASVPTGGRGVLRVGPTTVTRRDPLGLLRRELSWRERHLVHVHPRTVALPSQTAGMVRDLEGQASRRLTDSDLSFHAVREYVPGDAVRHVHWKATAKTGTLMVRQFEESQAARMAVLFDARPEEYVSSEAFELGVSVAASLSVQAVRTSRENFVAASRRGRVSNFAELPSRNVNRLLDAWAEVERATDGPRLEAIAHSLAASNRKLSVVVLVTGSGPELSRIRRAAIAFPPDVRVLAVRCELFGEPRVQRIDPLTVCTVGALEDLPGLMLRGAL